MSADRRTHLLRRAIVLVATIAVIGIAAGTVKVAADWRAASAALEEAPVAAGTLAIQLADELARADAISAEIMALGSQLGDLRAALGDADGRVAGDSAGAEQVRADLESAKARLEALQAQLATAKARLDQLNAAAARQAKANAAPAAAPPRQEAEDDD